MHREELVCHRLPAVMGIALAGVILAACGPSGQDEKADRASNSAPEPLSAPQEESTGRDRPAGQSSNANIVEVTALDFAFQAPREIPSGWTTFRMKNQGKEHHLLLLYRLPEGKTFQDYLELREPFERVMEVVAEGKVDSEGAVKMLRSALPEWSSEVRPMGGPGLVVASGIAQTTVNLEPGNYVMECDVKTPKGHIHASLGMVAPLTVTNESSSASAPTADAELKLSGDKFLTESKLGPGVQTIAVHFDGAPPDVHLARVTENTDRARLAGWMDLLQVDGMREPAPADFLGGANGMPVGHTAYFTVDLAPGHYAWVSRPIMGEGLVDEFEVE